MNKRTLGTAIAATLLAPLTMFVGTSSAEAATSCTGASGVCAQIQHGSHVRGVIIFEDQSRRANVKVAVTNVRLKVIQRKSGKLLWSQTTKDGDGWHQVRDVAVSANRAVAKCRVYVLTADLHRKEGSKISRVKAANVASWATPC